MSVVLVRRAKRWIAHWSPWLLGILFADQITGPWWTALGTDLVFLCGLAVLLVAVGHSPKGCEQCKRNTPAKPWVAVAKHGSALWVNHHAYLVIASVIFGSVAAALLLPKGLGVAVSGTMYWAMWIVLIRSKLRHLTLWPWCPICNPPRDDGSARLVPDPLPGQKERSDMAAHSAYSPEIVGVREGAEVGRSAALQLVVGLPVGMALILGAFFVFPSVMLYVLIAIVLLASIIPVITCEYHQKGTWSYDSSAWGYDGEEYPPEKLLHYFFRPAKPQRWIFLPGKVEITPPAKKLVERYPLINGEETVPYFLDLHLTGQWDSHFSDLTDKERVLNHKAVVKGGPVISRFGRGAELIWITTRADRSLTTISTAVPDEWATVGTGMMTN
jgi:hypothetical protein